VTRFHSCRVEVVETRNSRSLAWVRLKLGCRMDLLLVETLTGDFQRGSAPVEKSVVNCQMDSKLLVADCRRDLRLLVPVLPPKGLIVVML
jgi:hypothetical protein